MRYHKANHHKTDGTTGARGSDREREAERILGQSLDAARTDESGPTTSLAILKTLVEARDRQRPARENIFMSAIKHPMSNRKLSFGVVLAVAVFAFLTLVPFEYQQTVGYQATYAGISPAVSFDLDRLESALSALGYDDADYGLHATTDGTVCKVSGLPSRHAVREVTAAMVSLADFQGEPEVTPMIETVSGSLYAQVKCEIGSLDDFDMEGMTDEEVTTEIKKRLAEQGCYDADVQVNSKTAADGKESRQICVKMADDGSAASSTVCSVGFLENCGIDDKNKTDAEVEEEIRKRCEANGNSDVEVSVTTRADGKRRIEMKCKPADN